MARKYTHHVGCDYSIPNYNIKSKVVNNPIGDRIRRVIVEELYGRLRVIFPDESHLLVDTER